MLFVTNESTFALLCVPCLMNNTMQWSNSPAIFLKDERFV